MQDDTLIDAMSDIAANAPGVPLPGGETQSAHVPERVIRTYAKDLATVTHTAEPAPAVVDTPKPTPPPQPPPVPKAPPAVPQEDRNAILARLRARAEVLHTAPTPVEPSASERLIEPSTLAPAVPETFVPPAPIEPPISHEKVFDTATGLHTYKNDFAERIEEKGASAMSVLAAESDDTAHKTQPEPIKKTSIALVIIGIVIALLGAAAVYATYGYVKTSSQVIVAPTAPSLIFVDERQELTGSGHALLTAFADSTAKPLTVGAVRLVYTSVSTTTAGITSTLPAPGGVFVANLQLPAPEILLRSVQPESTAGVVRAGSSTDSEQRAFFILRVDSYERSFAGMLAWETTIAQDLALLYPSYPVVTPVVVATPVATTSVATTTATSTQKKTKSKVATTTPVLLTPTVIALPQTPPTFKDETVESHDVRVLRDANGRTLLMYGYWNPTTLIIARDTAAFTELVNRLATTRQQ